MRSYEALLSGLLLATEAKLDKCPGNDGVGEIAQVGFCPKMQQYFFYLFPGSEFPNVDWLLDARVADGTT